MRISLTVLSLATVLLLSALLVGHDAGTASAQQDVDLEATLSGDAEVPPVSTSASGTFTATLNAARTEVSFQVSVSNGTGVTQAHIHCGAAGENGDVAAFLFGQGMSPGDQLPSPPPAGIVDPAVNVDGTLSTGTLTAANLIGAGPCAASFDAFADALINGQTYVNVHTETYPPGEVRGQIAPSAGSGDVNGDGKLTITDALLIAQHVVGETTVDEATADRNGDGKVTITDALLVAQEVVGLI